MWFTYIYFSIEQIILLNDLHLIIKSFCRAIVEKTYACIPGVRNDVSKKLEMNLDTPLD